MPHLKSRHLLATFIVLTMMAVGWKSLVLLTSAAQTATGKGLTIKQDEKAGTISVFRAGNSKPILTQNAKPDSRPYLHPIVAPDGQGVLTEDSPDHHKHQTGLYWGFTRVNGRDYFHNPDGEYWRRVSAAVLQGDAKAGREDVRWQTVYDLLDESGTTILTETQRWSMRERNGPFVLDLNWRGDARTDVTIGKYDYGGLFLRMPWRKGIAGEVVNAARQRDERAEGQRAMWIDVGMQVEGRSDLAHVAIFDYPDNGGYPQTWRVDGQLGVGSARTRTGDWTIAKGQAGGHPASFRHLYRHAERCGDDERMDRIQRQQVDLRAVAHRAGRRRAGDVSDGGAGRCADDDHRRLHGQCVGRRTDADPADGILLGRSRPPLDRREPGLRITSAGILECRVTAAS